MTDDEKAPKERPILFSGEMVRAILDGRKTQTRRIVKNPEYYGCPSGDCPHSSQRECNDNMNSERVLSDCPFGKPGDRLWVRESWCMPVDPLTSKPLWSADGNTYAIAYRADPSSHDIECLDDGDGFTALRKDGQPKSPWRSPIYMKRWMSRITLEIENVRVERLQDISEDNAVEEGMERCCRNPDSRVTECACGAQAARHQFFLLWDSIHGVGAWERNAWVWVIEFKRINESPEKDTDQ